MVPWQDFLGQLAEGCSACAGVQMAEAVPDSYLPEYDIDDAEENPDLRLGRYARSHLVVRDREDDFYDDDTYD